MNRPLVRIEAPGFADPLIAFIDTGFNGALIVDEAQAGKLGFQVSKNAYAGVRLASQRDESFFLGRGVIPWFGENKAVTAYVLIETQQERNARTLRKTEEEILLGTELMVDCRLDIDFSARKVMITKAG